MWIFIVLFLCSIELVIQRISTVLYIILLQGMLVYDNFYNSFSDFSSMMYTLQQYCKWTILVHLNTFRKRTETWVPVLKTRRLRKSVHPCCLVRNDNKTSTLSSNQSTNWVLIVCVLLGISPASVWVLPMFRDPLSVPSSRAGSKYEVWILRGVWLYICLCWGFP